MGRKFDCSLPEERYLSYLISDIEQFLDDIPLIYPSSYFINKIVSHLITRGKYEKNWIRNCGRAGWPLKYK